MAEVQLANGIAELRSAQEFLARVVPWPDNGPDEYINIHWRFQTPQHDKPGWSGRATRTIQEALKTVSWQLRKDSSLDIYVCMSSQRHAKLRVTNGREWLSALRHSTDAVFLKSLYADVDVKPGAYASTREALKAVWDVCAKINIPRPQVIVQSGSGGLHVYWVLEEKISLSEWLPLARGMQAAFNAEGLRYDKNCTVDAARILRVPGTRNYKSPDPKPVRASIYEHSDYPIERIREGLDAYIQQMGLASALPARAPLVGEDDLAGGIHTTQANPIDLSTVVPHCGFIREALNTGGQGYDNTLWNYTTLAATFAENGRARAHEMAHGHPSYKKEDTDALYDRKERERAERGLGWPLCSTISGAGCGSCSTCPNLGLGKSPLHFGQRTQSTPQVAHTASGAPLVLLPPGFTQDKNGRICSIATDPHGNQLLVPIVGFSMHDVWIQGNPYVMHFTSKTQHATRRCKIAFDELYGDTILRVLGKQGLGLLSNEIKGFRDFMVSWARMIQEQKNSVIYASGMGWVADSGKVNGFTYAGKTYLKDGTERMAALGDAVIERQYQPKGSDIPWREAVKVVTDTRRPALDAIIATAFAAPLIRFTGHAGIYVSAYSVESGIGKTTAMRIAQAVWADPRRAMMGLDATQNSLAGRMGHIQVLPVYWDEIKTQEQYKKFVNICFQISSGVERHRMNRDTSIKEAGVWQTIMASASNAPITDAIQKYSAGSPAGLYRVFEYVVPNFKFAEGPVDTSILVGELNDNYGHIGATYAKWLGENCEQVQQEVKEMQHGIQKEGQLQNDERYWIAAMATLLQGATYANDLGFTDIDLVRLRSFLFGCLKTLRKLRLDTHADLKDKLNISSVLQQFLNANAIRHTLYTNKVHNGQGKPAKGAITVDLARSQHLTDPMCVHIATDDRIVRFSAPSFYKWLEAEGHSISTVRKELEDQFNLRQIKGRLGGGTDKASTFTGLIFELDLADPKLAGIADV